MSGNAEETSAKPDEGEWGIIVEKKRSIFQRITGKGKITRDDGMLGRVRARNKTSFPTKMPGRSTLAVYGE